MNDILIKAKESFNELTNNIAIDRGYSYPALYSDIRQGLNQAEENEKALKVIFGKILNNSAFQIEIIEDSDACIIIKEYCLGNLLRDFKIPFDRRYIDLIKKVVEKYGKINN